MTDAINPPHYQTGKWQTIEFIEDHKLDYCLGNAVKYISRAGKKDETKTVEDLLKANWYINRAIKQSSEGTRVHPKSNPKIDPREFSAENKLSKELTLAVSLICEFQKIYGRDLLHHTSLLHDAIGQVLIEINGIQIDAK